MTTNFSTARLLTAASLALAAWGFTGVAQADNVYWSVGVSSPGAQVIVGSAPPAPYYRSAYPVYGAPPPVYVVPAPVVYARPAPVVVAPPPYYRVGWEYSGHGRGWRHGRPGHENDRFNDRFEQGRFDNDRNDHNDRNGAGRDGHHGR